MTVPELKQPQMCLRNVHFERVRFGDTDAAGIVYYANFYRWFEAGRSELMRVRSPLRIHCSRGVIYARRRELV